LIGGGAGRLTTLAHITPQTVGKVYSLAEKKILPILRGAAKTSRIAAFLGPAAVGTPIKDGLTDIQDRFGLEITDEDLNILRKKRVSALNAGQ